MDVNPAMFNLSGNFENSELRSAGPPGTPPVQGGVQGSSYYFGTNNNPVQSCVFPTNNTQSYGLPFPTSLKMPGFNSTVSFKIFILNKTHVEKCMNNEYFANNVPTFTYKLD